MPSYVIGIHGQKGSGKDTAYERIEMLLRGDLIVERVAFADKLKEIAALTLNTSVAVLNELKNEPTAYISTGENFDELAQTTPRAFLQNLGGSVRAFLGDDTWVYAARPSIINSKADVVCVTDLRYYNEAAMIRHLGGVIWHVHGVEEREPEHSSEVPLPEDMVDLHIYNDVRDDGFTKLDGQILAGLVVQLEMLA